MAFEYRNLESGLLSFMVGNVNKPDAPPFLVDPAWVTTVSTLITPYSSGLGYQPSTLCTEVTVTRIDQRKAEICLAMTNSTKTSTRCASSVSSGRLSGIFMDPFLFDSESALLTFENGTLKVQPHPRCWLDYNTELEGSVEVCGEATMNGVNSFDYEWSMALQTSTRFTDANQHLGCFYATNILDIRNMTRGWNLGLAFEDMPNGFSQSAADLVFAVDSPANFTSRNCSLNTIMRRVPDGDGGSGDTQVCTKVDVSYDGGIVNQVGRQCSCMRVIP